MKHEPITADSDAVPDYDAKTLLRRAAACGALLCIVASIWAWRESTPSLSGLYLRRQDLGLLCAGTLSLLLIAWPPARPGTWSARITGREVAAFALAAALVAYAGSWLVMERYALSRDESLADFAAAHLQDGLLARPIPADLRFLAEPLMPLWADTRIEAGYWLSNYLPVAALIRAGAGLLGDRWLAGPLLLLAGAGGLWSAARRIWPERRDAAVVAVALALSSAQVLALAMTPYAMTAHFALNAVWIACFLRGGRLGHGSAAVITVAAMGLHQLHFHAMLVAGFVLWSWTAGRRVQALGYVAACLTGVAVWRLGYPALLDAAVGPASAVADDPHAVGLVEGYLKRLSRLDPVPNLARFAAWQNILLLPLAFIGAADRRDADGRPSVILALRFACLLGLATLVDQGHGHGYRYLHGLIPAFCLLGAAGWLRLKSAPDGPSPARLLAASVAVALLVTAPLALYRAHAFVHPYAEAHRRVTRAAADAVIVDPTAGMFIQDIVQKGEGRRGPLVLDLARLPEAAMPRLCRRRVLFLGRREARALGVPGDRVAGDLFAQPEAAARLAGKRRALARLGCLRPLPV